LLTNSTKEIRKGSLECVGNLFDIDQRYVSFATLNPAELDPIQATDVGNLLL